jgi:hypothetical protein
MLELTVASKERHDRFVQRVVAMREVWGLKSADGWACTASTVDSKEGRDVMPFGLTALMPSNAQKRNGQTTNRR